MVFIGLILINEVARRSKIGAHRLLHRRAAGAHGVLRYCRVATTSAPAWRRLGAQQPHVPAHEQLVPLREALRRHHRVHRFHGTSSTGGARSASRTGSSRFPFVIVAINILIAVVSDFESAFRAFGTTWVSSEGVTLYGAGHNGSPCAGPMAQEQRILDVIFLFQELLFPLFFQCFFKLHFQQLMLPCCDQQVFELLLCLRNLEQ